MTPRALAAPAALLLLAACVEAPPPAPLSVPAPAPPTPAAAPAATPSPPGPPAPAAPAPSSPAPSPEREPDSVIVALRAAGPRKSAEVAVFGPCSVRAPGREEPLFSGGREWRGRFEAGPAGIRIAGGPDLVGILEVVPDRGQGFSVNGVPYAGVLLVTSTDGGGLELSNRVRLDDYLAGVLAGELFPDSPPESLRALAVLARSFALSHLADLSDDPGVHQAYRGRPSASSLPALRAAVASTEGLRMVAADGSPLPGYWYHSTCGGHTADASLVFGVPATAAYAGVECPHCTSSKYYRWEERVSEEDLRKAIRFGSPVAGFSVARRSTDGRVSTFRAIAAGGTVREVSAVDLRAALGPNRLRSTLIGSVEAVEGRAFLFRGHGWGHGVGLCQIGAMEMARRGCTAQEILAFYYPGTRLVKPAR